VLLLLLGKKPSPYIHALSTNAASIQEHLSAFRSDCGATNARVRYQAMLYHPEVSGSYQVLFKSMGAVKRLLTMRAIVATPQCVVMHNALGSSIQ
jgi:hypothetical protein